MDVDVRTAFPLTDELRSRLRAVAAEYTGQTVNLIEIVEASLIAGIVVQIGDKKFDMSVATRLKAIHQAMRDRASREVHQGRPFVEESETRQDQQNRVPSHEIQS